jgi:hypothetical protein
LRENGLKGTQAVGQHGSRLLGVHPCAAARRILTAAGGLSLRGYFDAGRALTHHIREVNVSNQPIVPLILKGVALAMGVAAVVLSILGTGSPNTLVTLLGIGLFCLALWALQKGQ